MLQRLSSDLVQHKGEKLSEILNKVPNVGDIASVSVNTYIAQGMTVEAAFAEAQKTAYAMGLSVTMSGEHVMNPTDVTLKILVPTDMSQATIRVTKHIEGDIWSIGQRLFEVYQEGQDITDRFSSVSYLKGARWFPVKGLYGHLNMKSTDLYLVRNNGGSLSDQLRNEVNEIDPDGNLQYPNYFTYTNKPTVTYKPFLNRIIVKLPMFILDGCRIMGLLRVSRNNVDVIGNRVTIENKGHVVEPFDVYECSRVSFHGIEMSPTGYEFNPPSGEPWGSKEPCYLTLVTRVSSFTMRDCKSTFGWGGFDGNYSRGIFIENSDMYSISGHVAMSDIFILGCKVRNHCAGSGWGLWQAYGCKHEVVLGRDTVAFMEVKLDYGCEWDGEIKVRDLTVVVPSSTVRYTVVSTPEPKYDTKWMGQAPDVHIDTVHLDLKNANALTTLEVLDLGSTRAESRLDLQRIPSYHSIKNITFSGKVFNFSIEVVRNQRDYSSFNVDQIKAISTGQGTYRLSVENFYADTFKPNSSSFRHNIRAFNFTQRWVKQYILLKDADYCVPYLSASDDMYIDVINCEQNLGYVDAAKSRASNSYNRVNFYDGRIWNPGWGAVDQKRPALFTFNNIEFGSLQELGISSSGVIGSNIGSSDYGAVAYVNGCRLRHPGGSATYDATLKERVLNGYVNAGVYVTS